MKEFIANILRGVVVGLANVIPGFSGGTMMVSMGIYDKLIMVLTHFVKRFKEAVALLVPLAIGMVLSIAIFAKLFSEIFFPKFPLQTNLFFIGLILGGLPVIFHKVKGSKFKISYVLAFAVFFALVVGSATLGGGAEIDSIHFSLENMLKLFGVGVVAAATMVIPGVSGSMIMMVMGYYNIIIDTITAFVNAAKNLDVNGMVATFAILIPFGIGVLVGIVAVAKLLEFILKKYAMIAYWAICGLIIASPFAIIIFMDLGGVKFLDLITGAVMLAVGFFVSMKLGEKK